MTALGGEAYAHGDATRSWFQQQPVRSPQMLAALLTWDKLSALGVTDHLDLQAGAYGTESEIRADLVPVAQRNAAARYGHDFSGTGTVVAGDTPLDVEAALARGARAVGVATGSFSFEDLVKAGAHAVLPDLTDTARVLTAILG